MQLMGRRSPRQIAEDDATEVAILCPDCKLAPACPKKGYPKITAGNRAAFYEYQMIKHFPAYLPAPFFTKLRDRLLIIAAEIDKIVGEKQEADAKKGN